MRSLTALSHNIVGSTRVSSKTARLHRGRANLEHKQLNPDEQGGKTAQSPRLTQGPDNPAAFLRPSAHLIFKFKQLHPQGNMIFRGFSVILLFPPITLQIMDLENILQMYQEC